MAFSLPGMFRAENTTTSPWSDLDVAVVVDGDPGQGGQRLALRAGAEAQHVLGGVVAHVGVPDLEAGRHAQVAQPLRDLRVVLHAAADEGDPALELLGQVDQQLQPVDARRERRHEHAPGGAAEDLLEAGDDVAFRAREAAPVGVRAVREQRQHALSAELGEPVQVDGLPVERRLVDLEVAGVDQMPGRRVDRERQAVRNAVRDAQELDRGTGPTVTRLPRRDRD